MKTSEAIITIVLALALSLAMPGLAAGACDATTLTGTYLYKVNGFTYKGNAALNPMAAASGFTAVGILRLDGLGGGSGAESVSRAGILSDRIFTPTYQVNADCTAIMDLSYCPPDRCAGPVQPPLPNLVVASDGSQANFLNTVSDTTILGEIWKVPDGTCSAQSLVGTYRFMITGMGLNGDGHAQAVASSAAFGASGLRTMNPDGTFTAQDVAAFGGLIFPRAYGSNYVVNADCSGVFLASPSIGGVKIYVAPGGSQFVSLTELPGTIISGISRKQ
jgi:hypothetical protein